MKSDKAACDKILKTDSKNCSAYYRLAQIAFRAGDFETSLKNLLKIQEINPEFYTEFVSRALGEVYEIKKDY